METMQFLSTRVLSVSNMYTERDQETHDTVLLHLGICLLLLLAFLSSFCVPITEWSWCLARTALISERLFLRQNIKMHDIDPLV